jgi:hypothetical protein
MTNRPFSTTNERDIAKWIFLITLVSAGLWFLYYGSTTFGLNPQLDNRHILLLAQQIAENTLPVEPFHRAPLYPYLLSLFLEAGLPFEVLHLAARGLNGLALALTAGTLSIAACRVWKTPAAGWGAGLLIALNPVVLYFAGDAFDITLGTTAFTLVLLQLHQWTKAPSLKGTLLIGLTLAIGSAIRPHLLPLALLWPIAAAIASHRQRLLQFICAAAFVSLNFIGLGLANQQVAGEFRMMPWQGAYNLWSGNGPNATGRIYAQAFEVDFKGRYENPARLESILAYEHDTGLEKPHSIAEMNAHWKAKTIDYISENPGTWSYLILRKAYYFLNSYEQYDNRTYSFHKQQHLPLRLNPIHWGMLLTLAVAGVLIGLQRKTNTPFIVLLICAFAIYAGGMILFYTTNRFRLPMVPLLTLLGSGALLLPATWAQASRAWKACFAGCILLTLGITYSNLWGARKTDTWAEDYAIMANASLLAARDDEAIRWANKALEARPGRNDMQGILVQAAFNQWAFSTPPGQPSHAACVQLLAQAAAASQDNPDLLAITGIYHWKLGQAATATQLWSAHQQDSPLARVLLYAVGKHPLPTQSELHAFQGHKDQGLIHNAILQPEAIQQILLQILRPAEPSSDQ